MLTNIESEEIVNPKLEGFVQYLKPISFFFLYGEKRLKCYLALIAFNER
jgi:hypothetical protein